MQAESKRRAIKGASRSYFDINQLELAIINKALRNGLRGLALPSYVTIGKNARILSIQKRNLEHLCRSMGREYKGQALEAELRKILSGSKFFSIINFRSR